VVTAASLTPEQAVDRLETLHGAASEALRSALERFIAGGAPPLPEERARFRYPELRLFYRPTGPNPVIKRAYAKFQGPGVYATTITQPAFFRRYLLEQLHPLVSDYGATIDVAISAQEMPYPYVFERGDELAPGTLSAATLAYYFPTPILAAVGDEVADGMWVVGEGEPFPLALFDAVRVDGVRGHGSAVLPADEALAHVALEASGRPLVVSNFDLSDMGVGGLATDLVAQFLNELAAGAGLTLHVRLVEGRDTQHVLEAIFKALGVALAQSCRPRRRD
jgi:hypothetical protein